MIKFARQIIMVMKRLFSLVIIIMVLVSCTGKQVKSVDVQSESDLAGLRVATVSGSVYDIELSARDDISLLLYNTESDMLQALLNDKTDVLVHDEVIYNAAVRKENGIRITHVGDQSFPTAFMLRKDEQELAQTINLVQRRMVEDGSMQRLKDFWLTDLYSQEKSYSHSPNVSSGNPIRVAVASDSAPIAFQIEKEWYGIEIDILREVGKELGRPLDIKHYDSASSFMAVQSGQVDLLCGCIFVTPEREKECLFSEPYHSYHPAYFVLDRNAKSSSGNIIGKIKDGFRKSFIIENRWKYITSGLWETLKISLLSILLGSLLGIGIYAMSRSRRNWLRTCARIYNGFMAGIPELVLLLIMFYVVFAKSSIPTDLIAVITFSLFFASGVSDIYASSLDAIPRGQTEAGLALGFTRLQTFFHIVMPQAVRRGLPLYKGLCVSLLKGTSIVGYIAIHDLTRAGDIIRSRTFDALTPLLVITLIYFLLVWLIQLLINLATPKKKVL